MYVAPPMRMGAWSMARVLRQRIEYYFVIYIHFVAAESYANYYVTKHFTGRLPFTERVWLCQTNHAYTIASYPGRVQGQGKMAWYRLFAHAQHLPGFLVIRIASHSTRVLVRV